jgi:hypothetical protein
MCDAFPATVVCIGGPYDGKWIKWPPIDLPKPKEDGIGGQYAFEGTGPVWIARWHSKAKPKCVEYENAALGSHGSA